MSLVGNTTHTGQWIKSAPDCFPNLCNRSPDGGLHCVHGVRDCTYHWTCCGSTQQGSLCNQCFLGGGRIASAAHSGSFIRSYPDCYPNVSPHSPNGGGHCTHGVRDCSEHWTCCGNTQRDSLCSGAFLFSGAPSQTRPAQVVPAVMAPTESMSVSVISRNPTSVRMYYVVGNTVMEKCNDGGAWYQGGFQATGQTVSACCWDSGNHIRVYVCNNGRIQEYCWDGSGWVPGANFPSVTNAVSCSACTVLQGPSFAGLKVMVKHNNQAMSLHTYSCSANRWIDPAYF
ncbi:hypothetical protein Pelo_657 [Pelomyxa schiedti]|nr:hypothetical protein Pelo_657 [Pelomyxa schiedti]